MNTELLNIKNIIIIINPHIINLISHENLCLYFVTTTKKTATVHLNELNQQTSADMKQMKQ